MYGDSAPSFTTMKVWAFEFKRGRKSLGGDERSGRPDIATTDENIAKVHQIVLDDHRIKAEVVEKRPHLQKTKILFHQDNSPFHILVVAVAKIQELRFELFDRPPYSPDLAPSDFFLFLHLKFELARQGFSSNKEAITFVNNYFAEKNAEYYLDG
ncbi:histone-lysine N-methyltransferase SETMAR [Trichonephila clavipes]|uniref:Histone-lysine N-methyltransferase SETMAR n=1 Tax=Trichonephila clavipes TaxID=2585209 RepID=A0A8X6W5U7_TRICX|nr:histone-lysine N-methyltransferase SETMAR [Trichonephila clavipes]